MKINDKMLNALNGQLKKEFDSAYLYLSMAAYFEAENLKGFAHWMKIQYQEEMEHAMKFYEYIFDRGAQPEIPAIDKPKSKWKSPQETIQDTYDHEKMVTESVHALVKLARTEEDIATENFLSWYISEQVEEEANVEEILGYLKMIGNSPQALFSLNEHLYKRDR